MPWKNLPDGTLKTMNDKKLATELQGDAVIPQFFMTGDGHRSPPFGWVAACDSMKLHFLTLMSQGLLCAHVEEHQKDVGFKSVPGILQPLLGQNRVFGWELSIYKDLLPVMTACMDVAGSSLAPSDRNVVADVVALDRDLVRIHGLLWQVGNPVALSGAMMQHGQFKTYYMQASKDSKKRNQTTETQYRQFLIGYHNKAMAFRTGANLYIGKNIQKVIDQYPKCTHIITCGNAHITQNPLSQYVSLPQGAVGVVDASQM